MIFTIGQVTKMYNISHDTLRYYDKIDLLKPSIKKENGYRYYTIREIELLEIILIGKQLEIPIKDIKNIIEKEDENSYIELFKNHRKLLQEKIDYLTKLKKDVEYSVEVTTQMKEFTNNQINEIKEEYIDKTVVYFKQNDYGNFIDIIKEKELIFKANYLNNEVITEADTIGVEIEKNLINQFKSYKIEQYRGNYATLMIKDTANGIDKFIYDTVNKIYKDKNISNDINIFTESLFTLFKNNKENIYFVKLYIEIIN